STRTACARRALPSLPARPPLFQERLGALEAVLGGAQQRGEVALEPDSVGQRHLDALDDGLLGVAQRDRRLGGQRRRQLVRRLERLAGGGGGGRARGAAGRPAHASPPPPARGSRWVPPPRGMMARSTSVRPSRESADAMRMSQASASS